MGEGLCRIGEVSRQLTDDQQATTAGFAVCTLCKRDGFILVRDAATAGERPLVQSALVDNCDAGEMPYYPEVQYQGEHLPR